MVVVGKEGAPDEGLGGEAKGEEKIFISFAVTH